MEPSDYLDALIKSGLKNDAEIARKLKITKSMVSKYRNNTCQFGPEIALKVAKLLKVPALKVAGDMYAARAKYEKDRRAWTKAAASLCLAASVGIGTVSGGNANANPLPSPAEELRRMFIRVCY